MIYYWDNESECMNMMDHFDVLLFGKICGNSWKKEKDG